MNENKSKYKWILLVSMVIGSILGVVVFCMTLLVVLVPFLYNPNQVKEPESNVVISKTPQPKPTFNVEKQEVEDQTAQYNKCVNEGNIIILKESKQSSIDSVTKGLEMVKTLCGDKFPKAKK